MKVVYENAAKTDHGKRVEIDLDRCSEVRIGCTRETSRLQCVRSIREVMVVRDKEKVYVENEVKLVKLKTSNLDPRPPLK